MTPSSYFEFHSPCWQFCSWESPLIASNLLSVHVFAIANIYSILFSAGACVCGFITKRINRANSWPGMLYHLLLYQLHHFQCFWHCSENAKLSWNKNEKNIFRLKPHVNGVLKCEDESTALKKALKKDQQHRKSGTRLQMDFIYIYIIHILYTCTCCYEALEF